MKIEILPDCETLLPESSSLLHLALQFTAPPFLPNQRRPVAFCLVIDCSGSMSGSPLDAAKKAAQDVLRNLHKDDYFTLIVFSDVAKVIAPLNSTLQEREIIEAIDAITPRGSTNLTDGWMLGRNELRKAPPGVPRRLLLLTDGRLNVGVTRPEEALQIVAAGWEKDSIGTSCVGFGDFYDDNLLAALAERCGGSFYDVHSPDQLTEVFTTELRNLQQISIENLQLRIRPLNLCNDLAPLSEFPFHRNNAGEILIRIGDLVSEEKQVFILASEKRKSADGCLLEIEATFESRQSHGPTSQKWNQIVQTRLVKTKKDLKINPEIIGFISAQQAGKTLCASIADVEAGRIPEVKVRLNTKIRQLEKYPPSNGLSDALRLLKDFLELLDQNWTARDQKAARYRSRFYRKMSSKELWLGSRSDAPTFSRF